MKKYFYYNLIFLLILMPFGSVADVQANELHDLKKRLKDIKQQQQDLKNKEQLINKKIRQLERRADAPASMHQPENKNQYQPDLVHAQKKTSARLHYYWDTREYNTFGLITSTNNLPLGLSVWGFVDLHGTQDEIQDNFEASRFFLEYRLSKAIDPRWINGIEGLGVQAELNDSDGSSNELVRFGLTYKHAIPSLIKDKKGWLQWRAFPYETDGSGQQISLIYYFPLHNRVWISGFADLNIRESLDDQWVIEPQLNIKLNDRFNFLAEYRFNGFEQSNAQLKGEGLALGLGMSF